MVHKIILISLMFVFLGTTYSCQKETQEEIDQKLIEQYVVDHNIDAIKHPSGLWYQIIKEGSSTHPNANSRINVDYVGTLIDGTEFDSNDDIDLILGQTIVGWQIGIPLIGEGGEILLIIPSGLGYGNTAQGSVPKNSVMIFRIKLHFVS